MIAINKMAIHLACRNRNALADVQTTAHTVVIKPNTEKFRAQININTIVRTNVNVS